MSQDGSVENFLDSLPELQQGEIFTFACHEQVPCFNLCCADLTLPLTPYDILRLCRHFNAKSEKILKTYTQIRTFPDTGFPLPLLKMQDGPKESCPFVSPLGCTIYDDRPGACRTFPLGRGTKLDAKGQVVERFFLVQEEHCRGFDSGREWTAEQWLDNQGLEPYNAFNDSYMRLMAKVIAQGQPINPKLASMVLLCLYQLDRFRQFLVEKNIFSKLELTKNQCQAIMARDEHCLNFAYDWLELVIFGTCHTLKRKA